MAKIRMATPADARRIADISVRGWQEGYRDLMPESFLASLSVEELARRWEQRLGIGSSVPLVAVEEEEVAGFLASGPSRDEDARAGDGEVIALYVDPARWGRGHGRVLWESCHGRMRLDGFREATLWVLEGNVRARRFYEAIGFSLEEGASKQFRGAGFSLGEVRYRRALVRESE